MQAFLLATAAAPAASPFFREVAYVDQAVTYPERLQESLRPGVDWVTLDSHQPALEQIAHDLAQRGSVSAIHLISHGQPGAIQLGETWLDIRALRRQASLLRQIGNSLTDDRNILIYGCSVAAGPAGAEFLHELAQLSGAAIAASQDDTGSAIEGGNWILERSSPETSTTIAFDRRHVANYPAILAITSENFESIGYGQTWGTTVTLGDWTFTMNAYSNFVSGTLYNMGKGNLHSDGSGSDVSLALNFDGGPVSTFSMRSADGTNFKLNSFMVGSIPGEDMMTEVSFHPTQVTITGRRDGAEVTTPEVVNLLVSDNSGNIHYSFVGNNYRGVYGSLTFVSGFNDVDEIQFSFGTAAILEIDDISISQIDLNQTPTLTATGLNPSFVENGAPVVLFGSVAASTNDSGQTFDRLVLTVSNVTNGSSETLSIGGTNVGLNNGNSGSISGTGNFAVSLVGSTATVVVSEMALSNAQMATLIGGLTYQNSHDNPGSLNRVVTITTIRDSGTNNNTANPNISSTVSVTPVNDAPTATNLTQTVTYTEDPVGTVPIADIVVTDPDGVDTITATLTLSNPAAGTLTTGTFGAATSTYNAGTGVWTVTGSVTNVNAALAAVAFTPAANWDQNTTIATRIRDAANTGPADGTITLTVTAVNDAPTATNLTQTFTYTEDPGGNVALGDIVVSDVDTGETITATLTLSNPAAGTLTTGTFGSATSTYNPGTGVWTVTGSVTDVNAALAAVAFTPAANWDQDITIATRIRDAANTGPADGTITLDVTPVNDAPTVAGLPTSLTFTEDTAGNLDLSASSFNDPDSASITVTLATSAGTMGLAAPGGIVVTLGGDGTGTVTIAGAPAQVNAYLDIASNILYTPAANANGSPAATLTVTANDGDGSGSVSLGSVALNVTAVNDAPTLSGGPYSLTGIDENTPSGGTLVSTILANLSHGDVDTGALAGLAVTASAGNGTWQYSTDGVTWNGVGSVSGSAALLLSSSTHLRYLPDGANGETATLTFRAWDQSSGTASTNGTRHTADATTNGGSTAFSTGTAQASLTVTSVNDAPVLTPAAPSLTGISDTDTDNLGHTVASIVGASITDVDSGAVQGIAISGLISGTGTWQYSTDNGGSWSNVGSVSATSALLLRPGDKVRFVPDGVTGTTASFTYRAWDQTGASAGQHGTKVDVSTNGGSTAFSTATDTAGITVTAVDDPAVVTTSGGTTAFTEGDNVTSTPVAIDPALTLFDSDSSTLASATVSVTGHFEPGQDLLGFTNDGSTMGNISASYNAATGVLTLTSAGATATLAQWQTALRTVTYTNSSDTPNTTTRTLSFVVNDGTSGSAAATKQVSVTSINDTPVVSAPATLSVTEDVASALTGISFSDADAGGSSVTATLSVASGSLAATSGGGVTVGGTSSALSLTGSIASLNAYLAGSHVTFTTAAHATSNVTLTTAINDGGHTGSGGAKSSSTTTTLTVGAVNDAPVVTAPISIPVVEDVSTALTGISFADVDAGSASVTTSFSVASGQLTAATGSGVTVTGSGTATVILVGAIADLNAFIAASQLSFTTAANAANDVVLTVGIDDGGNTGSGGAMTDTVTITLVVTAVNDAPVNHVPALQTVNQDATLVFSSGHGNAISVSDIDAGGGLVRVTLTASNGTVTLAATTGLTFIAGSGTNDATMTFEATLADLNVALNGLIFTPTPGFNGGAGLQIVTNDLGLSGTGGALTDTDLIEIEVLPINPVVTSVGATSADGAYKIGDALLLTVTFDQAVTVNTAGGTPSLLLETGQTDRTASYSSGSGSTTLTFTYTVQPGDASPDLDYASTSAFAFNGGTIRNATNNDAILALPPVGGTHSIAGQHALVIDGVAPIITSGSAASATYGASFSGYTITATDSTTIVYAATNLPPGLSADATTGTITGTPTAAGTYVATVSATDAVGNPSTAPLTFVVGKAAATVTLSGLSQTYDGSPKAATATTHPSGLALVITYDGSATIPTSAGSKAVVATIHDLNHQGSASGTLEIGQASQTVSVASVGAVTIGQPVALNASASSGLPVTFSIVSGPASLAGDTLTINENSPVVVRAIQAGNNNYLPASAQLTITDAGKLAQAITFAPLPDRLATQAPFGLSATASSGLPVTFTIVDGPAMLGGATLSLTAVPGTVTVRASQAGNATYLPAADVTQSFTVTAVGPLIYFGTLGHGETVRALAAQLRPDGKSGTMIGTIPGTGEGFIVDFAPGLDGRWTATVTTISGGTSQSAPSGAALARDTAAPRGRSDVTKAASLTTFTRTFSGIVSGGVLTGTIDELGLTFTATLEPPLGPTAAMAGYYEAPSLNSATGSTHAVVGTQGQVYVLIITASAIVGNGGSVAADGTFSAPAADGGAVTGTISATNTTIRGQITLPNGATESFSGVRESTLRTDRLINLSTRARIAARADGPLIAGFVIGGTAAKQVLVRGIGPALTALGVRDALPDPRLRVFDHTGTVIAENDNWIDSGGLKEAMARVGAFALPEGSADAALLLTLAPGAYTLHVHNGGAGGVALAEIYDAAANPTSEYQRLVNISSRGIVAAGDGALIGGFVITGNAPKRVLIRGSGPALTPFGLQGVLADPQLAVFDHAGKLVARNNDWETPVVVEAVQTSASAAEIAAANAAAGAFQFVAGARDAALIVTLAPGAYTAHVTGSGGGSGHALIEIYEIAD